jgi:hypothetical protein
MGHVVPQAPQFDGSVCTLVQAPPQSVRPAAQLTVHFPWEQTCPAAQAIPQPPQFFGSPRVSVHTPWQRVPML